MVDPSLFTQPYDHHLCEALVESGHTVLLATRPPRPEEGVVKHRYQVSPVFYNVSETLRGRGPRQAFLMLKGVEHGVDMLRLVMDIKRFAPDVIHFQWLPLPLVDQLYLSGMQRLAPVFLTVHDSNGLLAPSSWLQLRGWPGVLHRFDGLIVHLESSRDELIGAGVDPHKVHVIPHGVLGCPGHDGTPSRTLPDDGMRRLLAFGAIKPYKGLDILMNAFALLPEDLKRTTRLWVVGEPSLGADEVYAMGHHWGVSDFVDYDLRFVPDQELGCIFAASDAVIFPYRRIDASGVLMLVLPFAKPIVATSVGCFAELLRNHDHALLVPPEDPAALAQALEQVLRHPEESKQMAERARTLAQDTMSWSRIAEMTDETYRAAFRPRTSLLFGRARKLASRKVRPA